MENYTSQRNFVSPKQLQNNIREAICNIPNLGLEASADRFNLKADTLKRVLGIRQIKSNNGRIKVSDWARNNNISRFCAMGYLKDKGANVALEPYEKGSAFFCDDIAYEQEQSDYYSIESASAMLGMKRQCLDYYIKRYNIPFETIDKKHFISKGIDIRSYFTDDEVIDSEKYLTVREIADSNGVRPQNIEHYIKRNNIPFIMHKNKRYIEKTIDFKQYLDAGYSKRTS